MKDEENGIVLKIMAVLIVVLSVGVVLLSGYAYLLKIENDRYDLMIQEIRTQVLPDTVSATEFKPPMIVDVPNTANVSKEEPPQSDGQRFYLELFDFRKLILRSIDFLTRSEPFSYVSVNETTAFKLCIDAGEGNYHITRLDDGYYGVLFRGSNPLPEVFASRSGYGVQLVSHTRGDGLSQQVTDLRMNGYPAFIYKSTGSDGRTFYAAVLGVFPNLEMARNYSKIIDEKEIRQITGWGISDRYIRTIE